ncbi:MAG: AMIN domain-containing protein [Syntrophaceae bacterium]|nr:AMIN domain-containing protein [Syntrophaceae bacterium]
MNRICILLVLCLLTAAQAFGESGRTATEAGKLPGGAPVSTADTPSGTAMPVVKPGPAQPSGRATEAAPKPEAAKRPAVGKPGTAGTVKAVAPLRLKSIGCGVDQKGREQVSFIFDRPYRPVLKTLPGEKPRIYFDVSNASVDPGVPSQQDGKGPLIRQVRISHDPASGSMRVAIELVPEKDYIVRPILYRKENRLLLEIEPKKTRSRRRP